MELAIPSLCTPYPYLSFTLESHLSQIPRGLWPILHPGLSNTCIVLWYTLNHPDMKHQWAWGKPLSKMGSFSGISLLNSVLVLGSHWPIEQRHIHFRLASIHPLPNTQVAGGLTAFLRAESDLEFHSHYYIQHTQVFFLTWLTNSRQVMSTAKSLSCSILAKGRCWSLKARGQFLFPFIGWHLSAFLMVARRGRGKVCL